MSASAAPAAFQDSFRLRCSLDIAAQQKRSRTSMTFYSPDFSILARNPSISLLDDDGHGSCHTLSDEFKTNLALKNENLKAPSDVEFDLQQKNRRIHKQAISRCELMCREDRQPPRASSHGRQLELFCDLPLPHPPSGWVSQKRSPGGDICCVAAPVDCFLSKSSPGFQEGERRVIRRSVRADRKQ